MLSAQKSPGDGGHAPHCAQLSPGIYLLEVMMFGLISKAKQLREMLGLGTLAQPQGRELLQSTSLIAQTLFARENAGQSTTLRQLHQLTQISQPTALKLLADMQRKGEVTIEEELHDTFESRITLSPKARDLLDTQPTCDAA